MTASERDFLKKSGFLHPEEYFDIHGYKTREEVFPGEWIYAINNRQKLEEIWWTIRDKAADGRTVDNINARQETIAKVPMFKEAFFDDRILIPATSLFEWHTNPDKTKTKYEIWFDEPLFAFAGIARDCEIKGETRRCGAIITTSPNRIFAEIHNAKQRQAVVIREGDYEKWLDPATSFNDLRSMMIPLPESETHFKVADS